MAKVIDGKAMSEKIIEEVRQQVAKLGRRPKLAVVLVGDDAASAVYVSKKEEACERTGIGVGDYRLPEEKAQGGMF